MRRRAKTIPYLRIDNLKNHTLSGGTYLFNPYMGVTPPPSRSCLTISCESLSRKLWTNCKQDHRKLCLGNYMYVCILTQGNFFGGFDQTKACFLNSQCVTKVGPINATNKKQKFLVFLGNALFSKEDALSFKPKLIKKNSIKSLAPSD